MLFPVYRTFQVCDSLGILIHKQVDSQPPRNIVSGSGFRSELRNSVRCFGPICSLCMEPATFVILFIHLNFKTVLDRSTASPHEMLFQLPILGRSCEAILILFFSTKLLELVSIVIRSCAIHIHFFLTKLLELGSALNLNPKISKSSQSLLKHLTYRIISSLSGKP